MVVVVAAEVVVAGGAVVTGGKKGIPFTFGGVSQDSTINRRASSSAEVTESLQRDFILIQEKAY